MNEPENHQFHHHQPKPKTWKEELVSLVDYSGSMMNIEDDEEEDNINGSYGSWKEMVKEFAKGIGEMMMELWRSFSEVVKQSLGNENSFIVSKFGKPCKRVCSKVDFLNDYLPEDRDPLHSWVVIFLVFLLAFSVLNVNIRNEFSTPVVKKVHIPPPNARRIALPDGRNLSYEEQGVSVHFARASIIVPHSFLSSRLAGIPGLKASVLEEFGVHLITYDLPGFGESDPHPDRTLQTSASDMSHLADAVGIKGKFWVLGYSDGGLHVWAAMRFIPERLAGTAMFAPMINPYDPNLTKEERVKVWEIWTWKRKLMYILARRSSRLLKFFYRQNFFSGRHYPVEKWLSLSLGIKDKMLSEDPKFEELWQRNVEESLRQGSVTPLVEETVLQVSDWGFSIADLQTRKARAANNILGWLKSMYSRTEEEITGFLGPIHIWQGMNDRVVAPSVTSFVHRILPGAAVHMLPNDGHFTYLYFCDECHKQIFTTLYGIPQGPLQNSLLPDSCMTLDCSKAEQEPDDEYSETKASSV